jgi:hypothetical protein
MEMQEKLKLDNVTDVILQKIKNVRNFIYLFINFTITKTIEGTDNRTEESQIKSYLHITRTL